MTYRPRRIFAYSSGVLSWLRTIALLVVFSFMVLIVPFARARVYMCGRVVGWLPRAARRLFSCERAGFRRLCAQCLVGAGWPLAHSWWAGRIPAFRAYMRFVGGLGILRL